MFKTNFKERPLDFFVDPFDIFTPWKRASETHPLGRGLKVWAAKLTVVLLMEQILQLMLRLVIYPIVWRVFYIQGGAVFFHQQ